MWSLGIILYQLVSSWKHPFNSTALNKKLLKKAILNDAPDATLPLTSPYIKEIIEMLLNKNPKHRPNTDELMQN